MSKYIETAKASKELKSHQDVRELESHFSVILRNYFILRLAQLSWDLDTSSGEFSYSDFRHYWPQLSASPLEDPTLSRGGSRTSVPAFQPLQLRSWGLCASRASFIFQGRHQLVGCTSKDDSARYPWAEISWESVGQAAC